MMKTYGRKIAALLIFLAFYILLYKIYSPRVNAFGCFDDCFNFVAGYFLLRGKSLYSEIFFNHQALMAYFSYFIQLASQPINIYDLVLRHRQFVFLFGFFFNLLIFWRFRLAGLGFVLFYELPKFYLFGDRFLAEGLIVYPLVYMTALVWYRFQKRKVYYFEYILAAFFTWFVIFMRAPYIPLAFLLYFLILWGKSFEKKKIVSLVIFIALLLVAMAFLPLKEYLFNIVTVNLKTVLRSESKNSGLFGLGALKAFFYPIYLFFDGEWNFFRFFILGLNAVFLALFLQILFFDKQKKWAGVIILLLGLANLRVVEPGKTFYAAFHLLPWYALFILILFLMLAYVHQDKKKVGWGLSFGLFLMFAYFILAPTSYIHDQVDPHEEFITNFWNDLQVGEVVRNLSDSTDTLFLDGFDDLIYWQAGLVSPYQYSWYTSVMPRLPKYNQARLEMFANRPPDFYYGSCPGKETSFPVLPEDIRKDYQQLNSLGKPTCLYVKKKKMPQISEEKWKKAEEFLYERP